ncbi:MAG: c-type cytochrome biogenesis protein CcmI [Gammaproteobacteria bacterium]|nr:c-type cytochrome biogenesis protein CcmI [Gammaproteobacteria bacterium]
MTEFSGLFWLGCALLAALAVGFIAIPLWRARRGPAAAETGRDQANVELFRERKRELEADHAAGETDPEQFDALLRELQASLLRDIGESQPHQPQGAPGGSGGILAPLTLALLLPVAAWLMYQQWGQLEAVELMDPFQRTVQQGGDPEVARELVLRLGDAVRENPEQAWAWYFLGENLSTLGMFDVANSAYRQAVDRLAEDEEKALALGRVALTAYIMARLELTPEIREIIDRTLALNPDEPNVLQLLASDAEESGDFDAAIGYWRRLSQLNPDSQTARQSIANLQRLRDGGETASPDIAAGIEVAVAIAEGLALDPRLRVFISARNAEAEGMPPLAVATLSVADLPARVILDDSLAVGPFNLSSAQSVYIAALVSQTGSANRAPGDHFAESEPFPLANPPNPVQLKISQVVPRAESLRR